MKKLLFLFLVGAGAACLTAFRFQGGTATPRDELVTQPVDVGSMTECVSATGHIQPRDAVTVGHEAGGRVVRLFVDVGQVVKANDPLAQLDDRMAQLKWQHARVAVELAQAEAQRVEAGRDAAVLAQKRSHDSLGQPQTGKDVEAAELALRGAEAALKAAHLRVREAQAAVQLAEQAVHSAVVRSPIAGIVVEKRVIAGQQVPPPIAGQLFVVAPDFEQLQVTALVGEADIGKLRVGQEASFTVNAWPGETFSARVTRIALAPVTVQSAVQYPVTLDAKNNRDASTREWKLRCGMPAAIDIAIRRHESVRRLPVAATAVSLDETQLAEPARRKLARWQDRADRGEWQRVWVIGADRQPSPVFVRTGGTGAHGEMGIHDGEYVEVLGWDPEESPPGDGTQVLIAAPAGIKASPPGLKLF